MSFSLLHCSRTLCRNARPKRGWSFLRRPKRCRPGWSSVVPTPCSTRWSCIAMWFSPRTSQTTTSSTCCRTSSTRPCRAVCRGARWSCSCTRSCRAKRWGVEEVDTKMKGFTNGGICFFLKDYAKNVVDRWCTEAHAAELQPRVP